MPNKLKSPCRQFGCPNLTDRRDGYCEEHAGERHRTYKQDRTDVEQQKLYQSARWRKVRAEKLAADPFCEVCARARPPRITAATIVHHKLPIKQGGDPFKRDNLESICASCHNMAERHGG